MNTRPRTFAVVDVAWCILSAAKDADAYVSRLFRGYLGKQGVFSQTIRNGLYMPHLA